jgi:hypothetical protein
VLHRGKVNRAGRDEVVRMRGISRQRFDALAAYCRDPRLLLLGEEIAWFEAANGNILATIIFDRDSEFSAQILARDLKERFRWVAGTGNADGTGYFDTPEPAVVAMRDKIIAIAADLEQHREQGDETGPPVDFFTPAVAQEKLHPSFLRLTSGDGFSAARGIIGAMMRWYDDADGNFVEQFQTTGFDARMWELYLFAVLTEANVVVMRPHHAPDFLARALTGEFTLEATTINPSVGSDGQRVAPPEPNTAEEMKAYFQHYLPIRYAGPLTAKLRKEYWTQSAAAGKPLVFAIQDFHDTMSMVYSGTALATYLYGYVHDAHHDGEGHLAVIPGQVGEHRWGGKVVQSGSFNLPGAEHVSAVLFNSGGTLSKFNRMGGCLAGLTGTVGLGAPAAGRGFSVGFAGRVMTACGRPFGHVVVAGVTNAVPVPAPVIRPPGGGVHWPPPVTACTGWLDAVRLRPTAVMPAMGGPPKVVGRSAVRAADGPRPPCGGRRESDPAVAVAAIRARETAMCGAGSGCGGGRVVLVGAVPG